MFVRDDLNIAGRLTLRKSTPGDRLVEEVTAQNDITIGGRSLVARLFNKDQAAGNIERVSEIRLGSGGDAFDPRHPDLVHEIGKTGITKVEEQEITEAGRPRALLRLIGELDTGECNGELREAGLFTKDGVMYNRVTFATITKSDQFKLTLVWEILF